MSYIPQNYLYLNGEGVERNEAMALRLFEQSCDARNYHACYQAGRIYEDRTVHSLIHSLSKAAEFYQEGCNGDNFIQSGCGVFPRAEFRGSPSEGLPESCTALERLNGRNE